MCYDSSYAAGGWSNSYLNLECRSLDRGLEIKNSLTRTAVILAPCIVDAEYVLGGRGLVCSIFKAELGWNPVLRQDLLRYQHG